MILKWLLPVDRSHALPGSLLVGILLVCIAPSIFNLFGVDFSTEAHPFDPASHLSSDRGTLLVAQLESLAGVIEHTLLEWTAFCIAAFVVIISLLHYRISGDVTTPIIGVAFFMAGCMDAFHTLAADNLIVSVADRGDLVPFTWAICRSFNALILIAGVLILLLRHRDVDGDTHAKPGFGFVVAVSISFGVVAYLIIYAAATSPELPQTIFADAWITRPYDALPLLLFIVAGLLIYPLLYRKHPSVFAYALVISAIPEIVTQLHMTFGSTALFDNHFNIAHFLKIVAYSVPLMGLMVDYVHTQQRLQAVVLEQDRIGLLLQARKEAILNTALDCIICVDAKGHIVEFNPAAEKLFGYSHQRVLGQDMASLLIPEGLRTAGDFGFVSFSECSHVVDQGTRFESTMFDQHAELIPVEVTLTSDRMDETVLITFSIRDLSATKLLEQQFSQSQKMEAIGTLVGGIAHDFNNMLAGITGNTHLAKHYSKSNDKALQKLENIESLSFRAADMIKQLLTFARKGINRKDDLHLNIFIHDIVRLQHVGISEHISFELHVDSEDLHVHADATQLQQVLMNLIGNAVDAVSLSPGPCIELTMHAFKPDAEFQLKFPNLKAESYVHLSVSDNGVGIDASIIDNIFDPFFTTKEVGKGTGLGLAMVYGAIQSNDGAISVQSQPGAGTTFDVYLPRLMVSEIPSPEDVCEVLQLGNGEVILLVDDEEIILETGKAVLGELGYQVIVASDGVEAVELFRSHQHDIALVLLDVIMPRLGGIEAAQQIMEINAQANILFATGYDASSILSQGEVENDAIVTKPYHIGTLSRLIRKRLSGEH